MRPTRIRDNSMKKVFYILLFLCICFCSFLFESCSSSKWTQQNLSNAFQLSEGMTKEQVLDIMGEAPIASDFFKNVEEWHYCSTGLSDRFLSLFFHEGKLIAMKSYTVTEKDGGGFGPCHLFIKRGTYSEPDIVVEIRSR